MIEAFRFVLEVIGLISITLLVLDRCFAWQERSKRRKRKYVPPTVKETPIRDEVEEEISEYDTTGIALSTWSYGQDN